MSASLELLKFVQGLPERDRSLYLLLRAYELHAAQIMDTNYDDGSKSKSVDLLTQLFQTEIGNLTLNKPTNRTPIYRERSRNDHAEKSTIQFSEPTPAQVQSPTDSIAIIPKMQIESEQILPKIQVETEQLRPKIPKPSAIFDPFADKLGAWASSFSLDSDSDHHTSGSDLSSEEEII